MSRDREFNPFGANVNEVMAAEFLGHLYRDVERGWLQLIHDTPKGWMTTWVEPGDLASMASQAMALTPRTGVYVPIATRAARLGKGRGGKDDCLDVYALVADIDVAGEAHPRMAEPPLPPTFDDALVILKRCPLPPTCLVHTGHGWQGWWMLTEPVEALNATPVLVQWSATWEAHALALGWFIDPFASVDKVFRLPGTLNTKLDEAKEATITEADWHRRYSLGDFEVFQPPEPPPENIGPAKVLAPQVTRDIGPTNIAPSGIRLTTGADSWMDALEAELARTPWADTLTRCAFQHHHDGDAIGYWTRPGKDVADGYSVTINANGTDRLINFSPNVPHLVPYNGSDLTPSYDRLDLIAAYEHGGDRMAAARAAISTQLPNGNTPNTDDGTSNDVPPEPSTWAPIDLTEALTGNDVAPPTLLRRADEVALLYLGRTHQLAGESEGCKTWCANLAAVQVLAAGGRVLWVDFEDDQNGIVSRLRSLGADPAAIAERFVYLRPEEPLAARDGRATAGAVDFGRVLTEAFDLAIIDGVTESMVNEGLDLMSNADVATWSRRLPKRIAAATGAATVSIDHVVKNADNRGRFAIGGQHKLAGLTGAAYRFDVVKRLARATDEPVTGAVTISVMKDRPGHVRAHAIEDRVGTLELTAWPDGGVTMAIVPPGDAVGAPPLALVKRIIDYLGQYDGAAKGTIEREVEGNTEAIREALRWMAEPVRGWLVIKQVGAAHRHYLTDAGRSDLS